MLDQASLFPLTCVIEVRAALSSPDTQNDPILPRLTFINQLWTEKFFSAINNELPFIRRVSSQSSGLPESGLSTYPLLASADTLNRTRWFFTTITTTTQEIGSLAPTTSRIGCTHGSVAWITLMIRGFLASCFCFPRLTPPKPSEDSTSAEKPQTEHDKEYRDNQ
ncbi:hypothetical protein F5B17DRAFT_188187 [Nemania serpens]|nr:hypothetical protein F5B17DRAFT_188187 [Nemania serpens]